ncbi:CCA tRNA nucleotidyltransferase [Paenibacillus sp. DMB20]|uniref:CCA tRNA nucleotidyltransferase n=1 Tax=Paenibacillus sp. DMB20 TaxID=1642570 RepID=UPI000627D80E|nr:CCA tRNA nucleotidyltransferase [Paenibacillus sp. DMB20]KKO51928.1 tRNA nucleotidyltransferase [Paenibacillus sp. DMB20]
MAEHRQDIKWKYADPAMAAGSAEVIRILLENGYEAYWVGGCVRDEYMGRNVSDMDITTSALPEATSSIFERVIPTGIKHGTVTVMMNGQPFEVTTYRVEEGYEDHRRPSRVTFVREIEEDLRRRDFTMNAMALGIDGTWVDPFDGRKDIDLRLIRCVGEARLRFREDALRMVRCIRFASVFGFSIAKATWTGMLEERDTLSWVAMERIRSELDKMMSGPDPLRGLELLKGSGLHSRMKIPFPYKGHEQAIMQAIPEVPSERLDIRWALLLFGCGIKAAEADMLLREWTFSNRRRELILGLLAFQETWFGEERGRDPEADRLAWVRLVIERGADAAENWLLMQEAISPVDSPAQTFQVDEARKWLREMEVRELKDLGVSGNELLKVMDRRGGPWVGEVLNHLLLQCAAGFLVNDKQVLIEEAKRVMNNEVR